MDHSGRTVGTRVRGIRLQGTRKNWGLLPEKLVGCEGVIVPDGTQGAYAQDSNHVQVMFDGLDHPVACARWELEIVTLTDPVLDEMAEEIRQQLLIDGLNPCNPLGSVPHVGAIGSRWREYQRRGGRGYSVPLELAEALIVRVGELHREEQREVR